MYQMRHFGDSMNKVELLNKISLFSVLSDEEKCCLMQDERTAVFDVDEGEFLYNEDKNAEPTLCVLIDGVLDVFREHNGAKVFLNQIKSPGIIGASVLFGSDSRFQTTVKAVKRCNVIVFQQSQLIELINSNGDFAVKYITFLSDKIRFLNNKIASFTSGNAVSRLSSYLIKNSINGECKISRTRLASEIDIGRASLYRAIDVLTEQKLIITDGKKIFIPDEQKLIDFARELQ